MFKCEENRTFTYDIQSVVHGKIHQHSTLYSSKQCSVNTNWVIHYCCLFSISTTRKMHDFQGYFSRSFQEAWEPCQQHHLERQFTWHQNHKLQHHDDDNIFHKKQKNYISALFGSGYNIINIISKNTIYQSSTYHHHRLDTDKENLFSH